MKTLQEYAAAYDPYRMDNPRYVPEDRATLQYARVSVIADDRWIGSSLHPYHLTWAEAYEMDFVHKVQDDYRHAEKLELVVECYEHRGSREKRGLKGGELSLFCMGALDFQIVSYERKECCLKQRGDRNSAHSVSYQGRVGT